VTSAGGEQSNPELIRRAEGDVLWLVLNRPQVRNAMTPQLRQELTFAVEDASRASEVRAIVLTGSGGSFCAGADLGEQPGAAERAVGALRRQVRDGVQRLVAAVMDCDKPVIAAVDGIAAGVGAHVAFACDLVLASPDARFIEAFVRRGLAADGGGAWLLPRLVGLQRAKELLFLGDEVGAEAALRLGLVNRVTADLDGDARALANRLAEGPTLAIAAMKRLANRAFEHDRDIAFEAESSLVELVRASRDATEGIAAFRERRPPRYSGR